MRYRNSGSVDELIAFYQRVGTNLQRGREIHESGKTPWDVTGYRQTDVMDVMAWREVERLASRGGVQGSRDFQGKE